MAISTIGGSSSSGGLQQYEQLFTTSGTWNKPASVKTCEVTILGGTGGNASGYPTSAGGYWKGIVDVSALSSVSITVGAAAGAGASGGTSSFGTLVGAPGSIAGAYYTSRTGTGYAAATSVSSAGLSDRWGGISSGGTKLKIAQDGNFIAIQGSTSGYNIVSTNAGQSWQSMSSVSGVFNDNTKILGKNSVYVAAPLSGSSGNPYTQITVANGNYGTSFSAASGVSYGYFYGLALGPAGFLSGTSNGWLKSTDGVTWTSVTMSGIATSTVRLQATSTRYYAFPYDSSTSTVYTSTDGVNWTSFSMAWTISAYQDENKWATYKDKVYYAVSNTSLGVIDGTSSYTVSATSLANFIHINSPFWTNSIATNGNVYSPDSPTTPMFLWANISGYMPGILPGPIYFRASSSVVATIDRIVLMDGSNGYTPWNPGSAAQGSPGVLSSGVNVPSTSYTYPTPGRGQEDGWGQGASGSGAISATTYGSGVTTSLGNQGVVRVRWWA